MKKAILLFMALIVMSCTKDSFEYESTNQETIITANAKYGFYNYRQADCEDFVIPPDYARQEIIDRFTGEDGGNPVKADFYNHPNGKEVIRVFVLLYQWNRPNYNYRNEIYRFDVFNPDGTFKDTYCMYPEAYSCYIILNKKDKWVSGNYILVPKDYPEVSPLNVIIP